MKVALTFDAEFPDQPRCPPGAQERVVEILAAMDIRATFFLQGRWAQAYPATARGIASEGHLIGSHSFYHARLPLLSEDGIRSDVLDAQEAIVGVTGCDPRPWFRCPWGEGWADRRVLGALADLGYRHVGWDALANDWEADRTPAAIEDAVVRGVLSRSSAGDGSFPRDTTIVLLHTWPGQTAVALGPIIERLRATGARFVTVDELPIVTLAAEAAG